MTEDDNQYLLSLAQQQGIDPIDLPGRVGAMQDRLRAAEAYTPEIQRLQGQIDRDSLGLAQLQSQGQPSLMDRGLGLARQGTDAVGEGLQAITPSRDTLSNIFMALEAGGAHQQGRDPLYLKQQQMQQDQLMKRMTLAQQLQQQQETVRQNQWEDVFKVLGNDKLSPPQQTAMLKKMGEQNPHAARAAMTVNDKMLGRFQANKDYLARTPEEYMEGLKSGAMDWESIAADIDAAEEIGTMVRKENASTAALQKLERMAKERPDDQALQMAFRAKQAELQKKIMDQEINVATAPAQIAKPFTDLTQANQNIARGNAPIVSPGFTTPGGETAHIITDPATGQRRETSGIPMSRQQTGEIDRVLTPEQAGRVASMNTSMNNIAELNTMLVKDGKVDRRMLASSVFGGLPFSQGRDINRFIEDAIETKLRLQTGAAANKDEVIKEAAKFKPKQLDSDETIIGKLNSLDQYMHDAFNAFDPSGQIRARLGSSGSNIGAPPVPFDTAYQDLKKKRPDWSEEQVFRELHRRGVRP